MYLHFSILIFPETILKLINLGFCKNPRTALNQLKHETLHVTFCITGKQCVCICGDVWEGTLLSPPLSCTMSVPSSLHVMWQVKLISKHCNLFFWVFWPENPQKSVKTSKKPSKLRNHGTQVNFHRNHFRLSVGITSKMAKTCLKQKTNIYVHMPQPLGASMPTGM